MLLKIVEWSMKVYLKSLEAKKASFEKAILGIQAQEEGIKVQLEQKGLSSETRHQLYDRASALQTRKIELQIRGVDSATSLICNAKLALINLEQINSL